jgi:hypothetical protein
MIRALLLLFMLTTDTLSRVWILILTVLDYGVVPPILRKVKGQTKANIPEKEMSG